MFLIYLDVLLVMYIYYVFNWLILPLIVFALSFSCNIKQSFYAVFKSKSANYEWFFIKLLFK